MTSMPPTGWATGMSDLQYADRLSRAKTVVQPLQEKEDVTEANALAGSSHGSAVEGEEIILLGHTVSAGGVVMD